MMGLVEDALLRVEGLSLAFDRAPTSGSADRELTILSDVSFSIGREETLAVIGESGAGKSLLAACILGLVPEGARRSARSIRFDGRELTKASERELCAIRGSQICFVPQEPGAAMNPVMTVGAHVAEPLRLHGASRAEAKDRAIAWLDRVGLPSARALFDRFPHELSGGMQQRALLAAALAPEPELLVADEPTAMLDATTREDVLRVLLEERARRPFAMMIVSHDVVRVAKLASRAVVLYAGEIIEETRTLVDAPRHPYTRGLVGCIAAQTAPKPRGAGRSERIARLGGEAPNFAQLPAGCRFGPRCELRFEACSAHPPLEPQGDAFVRCFATREQTT